MGLGSNPNPLRGKEEQLHYYGNWKEKILNTKHYLSWEASDHLHCNWTRVANSFLLSSLWPFVGKLNLSGQTYCQVTYHCIPTSSPPVDLGFVKASLTHRSTGHRFESYHVRIFSSIIFGWQPGLAPNLLPGDWTVKGKLTRLVFQVQSLIHKKIRQKFQWKL